MTSVRRSAFFDADETVITTKSMFAFLRHWMAQNGDSGSGYDRIMADIRAMAANNVDRSEINRTYYRLFKGVPQRELTAAGREWYAGYRAGPTAFVGATLDALDEHRAAGDLICLVSGSFRGVLLPLAEEIAADVILCTEPVVTRRRTAHRRGAPADDRRGEECRGGTHHRRTSPSHLRIAMDTATICPTWDCWSRSGTLMSSTLIRHWSPSRRSGLAGAVVRSRACARAARPTAEM